VGTRAFSPRPIIRLLASNLISDGCWKNADVERFPGAVFVPLNRSAADCTLRSAKDPAVEGAAGIVIFVALGG